MIPATAHLEVAWICVADLVPDPPQELDWAKVAYYADLMRGNDGHLSPPVVNAADQRGRYTFRDGRHRWAAHIVLGRKLVRCIVVTPPASCPHEGDPCAVSPSTAPAPCCGRWP